jgi:hypothetical protein
MIAKKVSDDLEHVVSVVSILSVGINILSEIARLSAAFHFNVSRGL